jgi:cyclophilin family peptidyl-prolyl cis-trans isomerase
MAQHKAPTAVTVAPLREKSGLDLWVSKYWLHASLVVLGVVAFIVVRHNMAQKTVALQDDSWAKLNGKLDRDPATGGYKSDPTALAALAVDLKDTPAGPSARFVEVESRFKLRDYAGALAALDALVREHPTHAYVSAKFKVGEGSMTLAEMLRNSILEKQAFDDAHPGLYLNPAPPADAPRVRLNTDKGMIVVALYVQAAPKHCENFLKLCREGYYNNTKFHRSVPDFMIQGGDPNSRDGDPATWGNGGPEYKVDPEPNELFHFAGVLAMAKKGGDSQSSGSQFYITSDPAHGLDGQYTVFGAVLEGMNVVELINQAPNAPGSDRPVTPVVLASTEVL